MPLARCNTIEGIEPRHYTRETAADLAPEPDDKDDEPVILPAIITVMNVLQGVSMWIYITLLNRLYGVIHFWTQVHLFLKQR